MSRRVRNYLFSVSDVVFTSLFESVSADQFSYQQDGSGDDGDQDHQNREVGDDGYEEVYEEIADFVEAVSKAVADAAAYSVGGGLFVGYFVDV